MFGLKQVFAVVLGAGISAAATMPAFASDAGSPVDITFNVTETAQVTHLTLYSEEVHGKQRPHFEIDVTNVGDEPQRYRARFSLEDGTATGILIPRSGDNPVVQVGESVTETLPIITDDLPRSFTVVVETL